jgi:hypothetical protein
VTALEQRLRTELRAESEEITPGSIVALRLPERTGHPLGSRWDGRPRPSRAWAKPLAAAAAVVAVIAGTLAITHAIPSAPPAAGGPGGYSGVPAYYAYQVEGDIYNYVRHGTQYSAGVNGRYVKIRATLTGKLLATVSPPKPYNDFSVLAAAADGRVFVLGAMRYWQHNAGPSPELAQLTQTTPMRFVTVRITAGGQAHVSGLSLPITVTPQQWPSIALSPDGTRLAIATGGGGADAIVRLITLATGHVRQWVFPHPAWTPLIQGRGAWTANGRTLALQQWYVQRGPSARILTPYRPPALTGVYLLDTAAAGSGPAASRLLTLRAPAGQAPLWQFLITPDGAKLIASAGGRSTEGHVTTGELAVYSTRTGALLRTVAAWRWGATSRPGRGGFPRQAVIWSNRSGSQLIVLQPRRELNRLGVITGHTVTLETSALLPRQPAGYQELQDALRTTTGLVW